MRLELDPEFELHVGHVLDVLATLPDAYVHSGVTSPPYYGLREYDAEPQDWPDGWHGQLGLEPTPAQFIDHLVLVFREVRRVLRPDGSLWVNCGSSYAVGPQPDTAAYKAKDLILIPAMLAMALQADGWWLRSENIWRKMGGMPESVLDRTSRNHEHIFHLTRSQFYFYDTDSVREPYSPDNRKKTTVKAGPGSIQHRDGERWPHPDGKIKRSVWDMPTADYPGAHFAVFPNELPEVCIKATTSEEGCCPNCGAPWRRVVEAEGETAEARKARQPTNSHDLAIAPRYDGGSAQQGIHVGSGERRTVGWEPTCGCLDVSVTDIEGHHPPFVPVPCRVLDPFVGSGTTMVMARRLGRVSVGIELSEQYALNETAKRLGSWWKDPPRPRQVDVNQLSLTE